MRRSSCIISFAAILTLSALLVLFFQPFSISAPPMSNAVAQNFISRGQDALRRHDADGIMDVMAPDARILGRRAEDVRPLLQSALHEVQGHLSLSTRNLTTTQDRDRATVKFVMDVGQKTTEMDAVYYGNMHVTLQLEKVRVARFMGLMYAEEWRVADIQTDPPIELPAQ
jgi:hypothetical protein